MRVLQINAVSGYGSTGRTAVELAERLEQLGHDSYITYAQGTSSYKNSYLIGTNVEKKLHALFSRLFGKQGYYSVIGTRKLIEYIESIHPDIVHLRNLHSNYINLNILLEYLAKKDIATVLTLHDCWFYTGKCTHYTVDNCYKWKTGCGDCPRLKKDNNSWFFDRTKKMYIDKKEWFGNIPRLAVVGVSDWITNEASESFLSSAKIISRIYNWIDFEIFKPVNTDGLRKKLHLDNKFIILGVASRWSDAKGLDKFIELANVIPNDMVILLVGNINKNIVLPENIIHIEETHQINELIGYYSMADVLLNLSLEETFGKVTAEALACGTPVIVIDSTANPELVGDKCGYVVKDNEFKSIVKHIEYIRIKGKENYSKHCIEYARDNFCKDDRIQDYVNVYKNLMSD